MPHIRNSSVLELQVYQLILKIGSLKLSAKLATFFDRNSGGFQLEFLKNCDAICFSNMKNESNGRNVFFTSLFRIPTKEAGGIHSIANSSLFPTSLYLHSNSTQILALKKKVFLKKKIFPPSRHLFSYL